MLKFLILFISVSAAVAIDCTGKPDGHYDVSCKSYTVCSNGASKVYHCENNKVYDIDSQTCLDESTVGPPCGLWRDCSGLPDADYPDLELNCTSYYTCSKGTYYGHQYCPESPGKIPLVFDMELKNCNWANDVKPPCGTKQ